MMAHRIEIRTTPDARAEVRKRRLKSFGFEIDDVQLVDVYTIEASYEQSQLKKIASVLTNPVTQQATIDQEQAGCPFSWAVEIGYLPGVTDNIGTTARESIEDLLQEKLPPAEKVYTSQIMFLSGDISREEVNLMANSLANPIIQRTHIKNYTEFQREGGMGIIIPHVHLEKRPTADIVAILEMSNEELMILGKQGIANEDRTRRGPLALDITYLKSIQAYFRRIGRNPTDVELEALAQTWSEHCKHTIFANPLDEITEGLFKRYIKGATEKIRREKGNKDFCASVFTDNSGAIIFDDYFLITFKAETHNSPSALDPFGGSITGIVGVNRDTIGFGLAAKPILNLYGFCLANPADDRPLYKGSGFTQRMLTPHQIMEGVIEGVNVGGNCSGIPTPLGFMNFDNGYKGKPLIFVGTAGVIPRESAGRLAHEKSAQVGDYIVMVGGRVGKDGIHGATFSSEALDSGSPATAVQIGDPITQKKLSDALVKEARDLGLYNSITDNGAGGLSCSVAEMAQECGGCYVRLDTVPLKYLGLAPWEIWISESQERMTLAVPPDKWEVFSSLMQRRGVEATIIGEFTNSGKCLVEYLGNQVMNIDLAFLHDGLPPRPMHTTYTRIKHEEPVIVEREDLTETIHMMLKRLNIASIEFVSQQYDHEVQGGSVIKPLQGRGRVNGDAAVVRPVLHSQKAVVIAQGINPTYSYIDTYHMAAAAIDTAIRNAVVAGANLNHLALMDNFCWCSSTEAERLGQLRAALEACYDSAVAFGTPFISGKDSMFNDFKGYNEKGESIKVSIPPTLLISSLGVIEDARKAMSLDAKFSGDLVYILGETNDEMGASEYFAMVGEQERGERYIGNRLPIVDVEKNKKLYYTFSQALDEELLASAQSIHRGGLAVALAKTSMGGKLGLEVSLQNLPGNVSRDDFALYSESQGRIIVTINSQHKDRFEEIMANNAFAQIGAVRGNDVFTNVFTIMGRKGNKVVNTDVNTLLQNYKSTFLGY